LGLGFQRLDMLLVATGSKEELAAAAGREVPDARIAVAIEDGPNAFDVVVSVGSPTDDLATLTAALAGLVGRLDRLVDAGRSAVIAGRVHVIVPGEGPVFRLYPVRPLPHLSAEDCQRYWATTHADMARAVPGLSGYRQFRADVVATQAAGPVVGVGVTDYVGAAEGRRRDLEAVPLPRTPALEAVLADEANFIDQARCGPNLYHAVAGIGFGG
jgi:hypothetical protein